MADIGWAQLAGLALASGLTVKVLDIAYLSVRDWFGKVDSATRFVDENLDPVLKSADELVGKLRALAEEDFRSLRDTQRRNDMPYEAELGGLLYLFARFWAAIELFRYEGLSITIAKDKRGVRLQQFLNCLESQRVRIVDRTSQRAIGESLVRYDKTNARVLSFVEFIELVETNDRTQRWIEPLEATLCRTRHTFERQQILQYGVVLHALIDSLDPRHHVTHVRPSYPNKLSIRSWRDLRYRVFGRYLTFVRGQEKYLGPPKRRRP